MTAGQRFLLRLIEEKKPELLVTLDEKLLNEEHEVPMARFISGYFKSYKELPSASMIRYQFKLTGDKLEGTAEFWHNELVKRSIGIIYDERIHLLNQLVMDGKIDEARQGIMELSYALHESIPQDRQIRERKVLMESALETLKERQKAGGIIGIPSFWPGISSLTHGYMGGNIYVFAARPKVGKTTILMVESEHAYDTGHDTMMISMEMTEQEYMARAMAYSIKLSARNILQGKVSTRRMRMIEQQMQLDKINTRYMFKQGLFTSSIGEIEHLITMYQPKIVFIDGAYLIRLPSAFNRLQRWERITEIIERLKVMAMRNNIPVVLSFQFNRERGQNESAATENIQYSDSIGMAATVLFGVYRLKERADVRKIKVLDNRNGPRGELLINWKWENSQFTQLESFGEEGEPLDEDTVDLLW